MPWLLAAAILTAALSGAAQPAPTPAPPSPAAAQPPATTPPPASTNPRAKPLIVKGPSTATATPLTATPPAAPPPAAPPPVLTRLSETPPDRLSQSCRNAALKLLQRRTSKVALTEAELLDQADFRDMHVACFNAARATLTSGTMDVGEEILRSVAQVVLNRAQRAAWRVLQDKLTDAAGCNEAEPATRFPATCKVLGSLTISDLTSSPSVLLRALVSDLLLASGPPGDRPWMKVPLLDEALKEAAARWGQSGPSGIQSALAQILRERIREQVAKAECDQAKSAADKALWVSGMCLIEAQAPDGFARCDVDGWASQCTDPITEARIKRLWVLVSALYSSLDRPQLSDYVNVYCSAADITIDEREGLTDDQRREAHDYIEAMRSLLAGIAARDWIEATSGAVRVQRLVSKDPKACTSAPEGEDCQRQKRTDRLLSLLAAIGNYAETFTAGAKDAGAAREKILEDLANRLVDRGHRDSGWVVSAGGNLGLLGGARSDLSTGVQVAFPAQLGLGLGLQTYSTGNHGFHAMATVFDLGQYVTFSGTSLKVDSPSIESSVTLGLTLGAWLGLRETPYYLGVYGGVSPFVKAQDKPTFQLGVVTGLYVPLLDFN